MEKLQTEVLEHIFKYLHFKQKLECKLVCRSWASIFQSGLDLESITIPSKDDATYWHDSEVLINEIRKNIEKGKKCKRLVICNYYRNTLAELFPNLNFLFLLRNYTQDSVGVYQVSSYSEEEIQHFKNWHNHLKTYIEIGCTNSLFAFLDTGIFHKLTTLFLQCGIKNSISDLHEISIKLKNAPNLSTLCLMSINVNMAGLETLHKNTPKVTSLKFRYARFDRDEEAPKNITPNKTLKKLSFLGIRFSYVLPLALTKYLISKYPAIDYINFSIGFVDCETNNKDTAWKSSFTHIMDHAGNVLKTFKLETLAEISQISDQIDTKMAQLEELKLNIFEKKDTLYNIVSSDIFSKNLHTLSLQRVPHLQKFDLFKQLANLKKLHLTFRRIFATEFLVRLNEMIDNLPNSLETLGLTSVDLILDSNTTWQDSNIRCLKWKDCRMVSDFSAYISRHIPKLKNLIIEECYTKFTFKLPKHHLSYVHISMADQYDFLESYLEFDSDDEPDSNYYYKFTVGNVTRQYEDPEGFVPSKEAYFKELLDKHDHFIYDVYKPSTTYSDDSLPHHHFQFASVQTLLLKNRLLLL